MLSLDQAIKQLRADPKHADLVHHAYLGDDVIDSAQRFALSEEFAEVRRILGTSIVGARILDVGSGIGIASAALLKSGAERCYALEPDRSDMVGIGAMQTLIEDYTNQSFIPLQAVAEEIPLPNSHVDIVYARQVLHHTANLNQAVSECARVLKPSGIFIACREHVVKDDVDLQLFLKNHAVHQLAGGENAFRLDDYLGALNIAGFENITVFSTFENIINYWPATQQQAEIWRRDTKLRKLSKMQRRLLRIPWLRNVILESVDDSFPGNMYTFVAYKPKMP